MTESTETAAARTRKDYSARLLLQDRIHEWLYEQIVAWLAIAPASAVLDAGCGAGGMTAWFAKAVEDTGSVAALDLAPAHLAATQSMLAGTQAAQRVTYHEGSVDALPFADGQFDLVWCSHVVHGQPDPLATARELRRVVKLGGRLVVREDLGLRSVLPYDTGIGAPGLEYRINAILAGDLGAWRAALPDVRRYSLGWTQLLRDVGCHNLAARTFTLDLLPPWSDDQSSYLHHWFETLRNDPDLQKQLHDADRHTLDLLTDPASQQYALRRSDLHLVETATVYVGILTACEGYTIIDSLGL